MQIALPVAPASEKSSHDSEYKTPIERAYAAWRDVLPIDPACKIIPAYTDAKLIELGRKIKASGGMKIPIIVRVKPDGAIVLLDGRSRLDAMCAVGIGFTIKIIAGHVAITAPGYDVPTPTEIVPDADFDPYAFVLSVNVHRRHLTNNQKRTIAEEVIKARPNLTDYAIAKMTGVNEKTVKSVRQGLKANSEIRITDRVEITGRKARGRKPHPIEDRAESPPAPVPAPADVPVTAPMAVDAPPAAHVGLVDNKPAAVPIAAKPAKPAEPKPVAAPNDGCVEEVLAGARKTLNILNRPTSTPNKEAAQAELRHVINLLIALLKPRAKPAERARAA